MNIYRHGAVIFLILLILAIPSSASTPIITSYAPALTIYDWDSTIGRVFNVTADQNANYTWYMDQTIVSSNVSTLNLSNYSNSTPTIGTHNLSVQVNNTNGTGNRITWAWNVPASTMSNETLVTNLSTAGRAQKNTNTSLNFSWTDTGNITRTNLTFPSGFFFTSLISANVSSNLGIMTVTLDQAAGLVSLYNATGLNNSTIYVNLTVNVTTPTTAGNYNVTITTNKNLSGRNITVYTRDTTQPYFVTANNSDFLIGNETFGTLTTTIPLVGSGLTNLTIYAPNIPGQINITQGYGATNVASLRIVNATGNGSVILYVTTDSSITNPVIVISAARGLQSSNLPSTLIGAGAIASLIIIYKFKTRTR